MTGRSILSVVSSLFSRPTHAPAQAKLSVESLDARLIPSVTSVKVSYDKVFSDELVRVLDIRSDNSTSNVVVTKSNNQVTVKDTTNGFSKSFPVSEVELIQFTGGSGNDSVRNGVPGLQFLAYGNGGRDRLEGNTGADIIFGGSGDDTLIGGAGDDKLHGQVGKDSLYGNDGRDALYGGDQSDRLFGGNGDDYLHGGAAADSINGEGGVDTFRRNLYLPGFTLSGQSAESEASDVPQVVSGSFLTAVADGADPEDVVQTSSGTCTILAALASVASKTDLESKIEYNATNDTYTVYLHIDGVRKSVTVNGDWTEGRDPNGPLWVTLYQKAYLSEMKVSCRGQLGELRAPSTWWAPNTNWRTSKYALMALTGMTTTYTNITNATPQALEMQLANATFKGAVASSLDTGTTNGIVKDHAYRIVRCWKGSDNVWRVKLQNPWGIDGAGTPNDGANDGFVTLTWTQFKANFYGYTRAGG